MGRWSCTILLLGDCADDDEMDGLKVNVIKGNIVKLRVSHREAAEKALTSILTRAKTTVKNIDDALQEASSKPVPSCRNPTDHRARDIYIKECELAKKLLIAWGFLCKFHRS